MPTHMQRARLRPSRRIGRWRSIRPTLARDEDLRIFLEMSRESMQVTARDLDELIRPA